MSRYIAIILILLSYKGVASNVMYLEPTNLSELNTKADEFAPSWNKYSARLYYTSTITGKEKLYTTYKDADGNFEKPEYLDNPINSFHDNVSYIDFIAEDKAYFSSFVNFKDQPHLQLFYTNYKKQAWSEGFPIENLASDQFMGQCSVSPDKSQIIFTQQSKDGDLDLMVSYRMDDGTWREPIALEELNTRGDEITPHFGSNDTLYFASNGQGGPGGFDIFFTVKSEGIWQRPSTMFELNTEYDESDAMVLPNGDLIFASNRPGGKGGLDLWLADNNRIALAMRQDSSLDIQLQSYINNIVVYNNYEYVNLPIANIFYLQDSTMELPSKLFEYHTGEELQSARTVEDSYFNSLNYIGAKIAKLGGTKLKITASYPGQLEVDTSATKKNAKYYADRNIKKIYDFLMEKYHISEGQISYSYDFYKDRDRKPSISLSSDEPDIFSQLEIRKDSIQVEQKLLPIDVKIEPESGLSYWIASIDVGGREYDIYESTKHKERLTLDLVKYKNMLFDIDNLNVKIRAYSQNGDSAYKVIPHNIEHHNSKKPKLVKVGNSYFDYLYLFGTNESDISSGCYKSNLDKILSAITLCKSVEISYNQNKKLAESLKKELQSKIVNGQITVNLVNASNRIANQTLDENLIIVKVEKFPYQLPKN